MYNIWFCKIISKDNKEISGIGALEYMQVMYEEIDKKELEKYAISICKELNYSYKGIIDDRYCLFDNNKEYCLFFEELLEE